MNKTWANYWIDIGLTIAFITSIITGAIKWPGLIEKFGVSYAQIPYVKITLVHDWSGLIMAILAFVHVILHWDWIVHMTKRLFKVHETRHSKHEIFNHITKGHQSEIKAEKPIASKKQIKKIVTSKTKKATKNHTLKTKNGKK